MEIADIWDPTQEKWEIAVGGVGANLLQKDLRRKGEFSGRQGCSTVSFATESGPRQKQESVYWI